MVFVDNLFIYIIAWLYYYGVQRWCCAHCEIHLFRFRFDVTEIQILGIFIFCLAGFCGQDIFLAKVSLCQNAGCNLRLGVKKMPVVPVSYREKVRVGRSEIIFFLNIFFHGFGVFFAGRFAVESRHQY
jgi:hypothetical protein